MLKFNILQSNFSRPAFILKTPKGFRHCLESNLGIKATTPKSKSKKLKKFHFI